MTGWRKRTIMEMAQETGFTASSNPDLYDIMLVCDKSLEAFAKLVREDEREKYKWDVHSCGPTCAKVSCVAMRKAVEAEREACAKVCEELVPDMSRTANNASVWDVATFDCATAIRARGQA